MRIFKNRGDIYFSKTNKKKSAEQRILIAALIFIVVFTLIFVTILSFKYDFSAKKFFAPENTQSSVTSAVEEPLPQVSGKSDFIVTVNDEDSLLFVILAQVDLDNVSYKIGTLRADTVCDSSTLSKIYSASGAENVKTAVESLLSIEFDYYIDMEKNAFAEFVDELGEFTYTIPTSIKFKSEGKEPEYSVRINDGEQKITGSKYVDLIRYYTDEQKNTAIADDLILNALSEQLNSENLEKSQDLFDIFVTLAQTNITVRDFSMAADGLTVLCDERTGAGVYSAVAEYDSAGNITADSLRQMKGYFVK